MTNPLFNLKLFLLSLLIVSSTISASQDCCDEFAPCSTSCCMPKTLLEFKAGYFFFSDSKMRKVYDKGGYDLQLCASYPLWQPACRWTLKIYGAVEYLQCWGHSINGHQTTSVWSVPINVGLMPVYTINDQMQYYFAVGPRFFNINQTNHSSYIYKNQSRNNFGFFANTGFHYVLCNHIVIDVFGEYSYAKMHFHDGCDFYTRNIQVGGFTFGAGIGYEF